MTKICKDQTLNATCVTHHGNGCKIKSFTPSTQSPSSFSFSYETQSLVGDIYKYEFRPFKMKMFFPDWPPSCPAGSCCFSRNATPTSFSPHPSPVYLENCFPPCSVFFNKPDSLLNVCSCGKLFRTHVSHVDNLFSASLVLISPHLGPLG